MVAGRCDPDTAFSLPRARPPPVRQIAEEETSFPVGTSIPEDVSPIVHKITEVLRSDDDAVPVERRLEELSIPFTPDVIEKVLKRCYKVGHLALRFFNWVELHTGFPHTTEAYNAMIYIAGEAGDFALVEKLVADMGERSCFKSIKTWTILISHYGKAKKIGRALGIFEEMRKSGCELDAGVYGTTIRALVNAGKSELAMEFYKEMVLKNMEVGVELYGMLMSCISRSGDTAGARLVADDMVKIGHVSEGEAYTCMLRSFCIAGKIDEARELFVEFSKKNPVVDPKVYEVLLKGLCRASRMEEAMEILGSLEKNLAVDSKVYGCLIDGFLRRGDVSKAIELLHSTRESGCLPMVSSYTQIIQHLFRSENYREACDLYAEMIRNGIEPDIVATTAMVAGHVQQNHISEAWEVFENMKKKGILPNWKAYSVFIKELCKASKPNEALKLLSEMVASKINATGDVCRLVMSSLKRNGEFEKAMIVEKIAKLFKLDHISQDKQLCKSLDRLSRYEEYGVSCCTSDQDVNPTQAQKPYSGEDLQYLCEVLSSSSDWSSAQEVLERGTIHFTPQLVVAALDRCKRHGSACLQFFSWVGRQAGYRHTAETYNMAIKISGSAKDFRHMRDLYSEMRRRDCSVTPNTWTIMISQYGQAGLTAIALRTFKEMKNEGFEPNASTFKYLIVFLSSKKGRKVDEAIKIFYEMMHAGFMPDKETVEIYLSSLCESRKLLDARRCVKYLVKRGFTKQLGYSLLVKSLCRAGKVEEGLSLVDEMEHLGCSADQFIYGTLVHALLRKGRLDEALDKVEEMKRAGIAQSTHIHTSLIVHFCKEKQIGKATEILMTMREDGCEPTVVTYSAMIRGYMNVGMVADAWDVFRQMKIKGPRPDFETYSMFITCLCKMGRSEDGVQLVHDMLESQIIPSAVNFRTLVFGLNREGKYDLARSVLQRKWLLKRERMLLN